MRPVSRRLRKNNRTVITRSGHRLQSPTTSSVDLGLDEGMRENDYDGGEHELGSYSGRIVH